jgi:hypothetical protein
VGFGGDLAVLELHTLFQREAGDAEGSLPMSMPVTRAPAGHALGEDAATAADVEHALAKQVAALSVIQLRTGLI